MAATDPKPTVVEIAAAVRSGERSAVDVLERAPRRDRRA